MADIKDLEIRLKQCQDVMTNVIENLNYIDRELRLAKQNAQTQPEIKAQPINQPINQPVNKQINQAPYQAGAPVNQGAYNQGTVNQNRPQNVPPQNVSIPPQGANIPPQGAPINRNNQNSVNQNNRPQNIPPQGPAIQNRAPQGQPVYSAPNNRYGYQNRNQNGAQNGPQTAKPQNHKPAMSIENIFGKNIMAIAASVLIFISLILFATLILPKLTKEVKFYMTLAASIGITVFGLVKWFKKKDNTFWLALGACGMGAIYITLFIGNVYFEIIGYTALFILLAVWTAGILLLSKHKKILFEVIGYCGITIAVFFGTSQCFLPHIFEVPTGNILDINSGKLYVTLAFFLIGTISFMIFGKMDTSSYIISNCSAIICSIPLLITAGYYVLRPYKYMSSITAMVDSDRLAGKAIPVIIILCVFFAAMIGLNLIKTKKENNAWIGLFGLGYSILLGIGAQLLFYNPDYDDKISLIVGIIVYAVLIIIVEAYFIMKLERQKGVSTYIWIGCMMVFITYKIVASELINVNVGFLVAAAAMIIYGYVFNDVFYKYGGLVLNIFLLVCFDSNTVLQLVSFVGLFALINIFMYVKNSQYSLVMKILSYLTFLIGITETISMVKIDPDNFEWLPTLVLLVVGFINALAIKTPYRKNWEINEDDKGFIITGYVVNAIMMSYSLFIMMLAEDTLVHWIIVITAIALFMINSLSLLKKWDGLGAIYVGIKSTILIITILASFKMTDNILSILVFLLSIILISIGFIYKLKGLRIYGLVLSLVCVVKLVMIDISYENTIGHALSFFLSGVLCFVISAIYSYVEKKYKNSAENA